MTENKNLNHNEEANNSETDEEILLLTDTVVTKKNKEKPKKAKKIIYDYRTINQEQNSPTIAVVGTGVVGGLIAGLLMRAGNRVICYSSPSSSKRIMAEGISIDSQVYGDFIFKPQIAYLVKQKPEIIIVAARATHIELALTALDPKRVARSIIIVITSGLEYWQNLKNYPLSVGFLEPFDGYREDVNRIVHKEQKLTLTVAGEQTIERHKLKQVVELFKLAGIDFKVIDHAADLTWLKNISFTAVSLIAGIERSAFKKALKNKKNFECMERIITEALMVAEKRGSRIKYDDVMKVINNVPDNYKPPLVFDLAKGQIGEIDAVAGSIVRLGERYEINCSEIKKLMTEIIANAPRYYEVRVSSYLTL